MRRGPELGVPLALLVLAAVACGSAIPAPATPTPARTPIVKSSPAPLSTATLAPKPQVPADGIALRVKPLAALPHDLALIIETGCWQCDGPTTSLTRVYQRPGGDYATETLMSPEKLGIGPHGVETDKGTQNVTPAITGFSVAPDASDMIVGICTGGYCGTLSLTDVEETSLFRSRDGGVTWQPYGKLGHGEFLTGEMKDGNVIVAKYSGGETPPTPPGNGTPAPPPAPEYRFYPSGERLLAPAGANALWRPLVLPDGRVAWETDEARVEAGDASPLISLDGAVLGYQRQLYHPPEGIALQWGYRGSEPNQRVGVFDNSGNLTRAYRFPGFFLLGPWVDGSHLLGNSGVGAGDLDMPVPPSFVGYLPALVDLNERLVQPIERPFLDPGFGGGRNHVVGVQRGSLARVVKTDSCLNVRAAPDPSARSLECVADGVLLRLSIANPYNPDGAYDVSGTTWYRVTTPSGADGFASAEYLER